MTGPGRKAPAAPPFWRADIHADRRPFLLARGKIMAAWRSWFAAQGFLEAEPGILQVSPGNEAHIAGFATQIDDPDGQSRMLYLHSSPEFALKKLLAAGEERLFAVSKVFRNGERGALHHPEFTMLEWYRARAPYHDLIADCAALAQAAARAARASRLVWRGSECDPFAPPEVLTVAQAFARHAGVDLDATLAAHGEDRKGLAGEARRLGLRVSVDDSWSDLFSKILSAFVEPKLGHGRMCVLDRYPACEATLAQRTGDDPRHAERFELYACGVELANAFGELTDAGEQRRRFEAEMAERHRIYGGAYPLDEDFLAALAHMPPASGIALGVDRLVMLACGATHITQTLWTPVP
ncbi:MAG: EF-P lysine aminoacylase GenX [Alphaproteobacteria bacterium]|nr:EF-P lysine aminoacylase GenX [Alphaproteobacteria bacterium]